MNPCEVCGKRNMVYPGVCESCIVERKVLYNTQLRPSAEAAMGNTRDTTPHDSGLRGTKYITTKQANIIEVFTGERPSPTTSRRIASNEITDLLSKRNGEQRNSLNR